MVLRGKQKAALLLMSLDTPTATKLLKGMDEGVVQELAVELAYLNASGLCDSRQIAEVASQFHNQLQPKEGSHIKGFLGKLLQSTVGNEKASQIQAQIEELLQKRDPFMPIRSADSKILASVLGKEHPQVAAVVLSELPPKKSSEVLGLLDANVRLSAVSRITASDAMTSEAKARMAETVCKHLVAFSIKKDSTPEIDGDRSLRKVAVILRNLDKELRDGLLGAIQEKDGEAGKKVVNLMILWEDIPQIADRSLQEALRGIDARKLALALVKADEAIIKKIKSNISERAAAQIDEETSLMSSPKKDDTEQARVEIIKILCEMNEKGKLTFMEE